MRGVDRVVATMQVGEICHATLPPEMAYGPEGWPPKVPGDATIEMDLELVGFTPSEVLAAAAARGGGADSVCVQVLQDEARKAEAAKAAKRQGNAIDVEVHRHYP